MAPPVSAGSVRARAILVGLTVVDDSKQFLVVSERGLGKRTPFGDYPTKGRGGKGVITMRVTEKTGLVTAGLRVGDGDDIMLMTNTGQSVRIRVSDIRITGRNASGVKLMNLRKAKRSRTSPLVVRDGDEDDTQVAALPENRPLRSRRRDHRRNRGGGR